MQNLIVKYFLATVVIILTGAIITVAFSFILGNNQFIQYKDFIRLISLSSGLLLILYLCGSFSLIWNFYKNPKIKPRQIFLLLVFLVLSMVLEYRINDDLFDSKKITISSALQSFLIIPVLEELVFRGIFQNRLSQQYGWKLAVLITSFLFMFIHFGQLDQMILSLIFSFLCGFLYYRTNTLFLCVVFHILVNFAIFLLGTIDQYKLSVLI